MESYTVPTPARSGLSLPVVLGGLITTALTLLGVWALNQASDEFNIMGWYGYYVIPVGALLVGIAAGSGYGIASWKTGVRISRKLLLTVLALQILAYFVAQYLEFRHLLSVHGGQDSGLDFFSYFDWSTRQFAFKDKQGVGSPLGGWGYAIRILEIAGFAFGGLVVLLVMKAKPYCESCQVYMRTKNLGLLPAGLEPKKIKKGDAEAQAQRQQALEQAAKQGEQTLQELRGHASAGRTAEFNQILAAHKPNQKIYAKQSPRISLRLSVCPRCYNGQLGATSLSGQGNAISRQDFGTTPIQPAFGRDLG